MKQSPSIGALLQESSRYDVPLQGEGRGRINLDEQQPRDSCLSASPSPRRLAQVSDGAAPPPPRGRSVPSVGRETRHPPLEKCDTCS